MVVFPIDGGFTRPGRELIRGNHTGSNGVLDEIGSIVETELVQRRSALPWCAGQCSGACYRCARRCVNKRHLVQSPGLSVRLSIAAMLPDHCYRAWLFSCSSSSIGCSSAGRKSSGSGMKIGSIWGPYSTLMISSMPETRAQASPPSALLRPRVRRLPSLRGPCGCRRRSPAIALQATGE